MTRLTLLIATLVLVILFFVVPALAGQASALSDFENYRLHLAHFA